MKSDTQHLDYLISQYLDGCLDAASRKSLEQQFVNDPQARQLYKEQRDIQDVLDDWGNRIPLIDWDSFDKKLASRLEHETVGRHEISRFRRWARPISAAAALFIAAFIGYSWHGWSTPAPRIDVAHIFPDQPARTVKIDDHLAKQGSSVARVAIDEPAAGMVAKPVLNLVDISLPDDVAALNSLNDAVNYGLGTARVVPAGAVTAMETTSPQAQKENKEAGSAFP